MKSARPSHESGRMLAAQGRTEQRHTKGSSQHSPSIRALTIGRGMVRMIDFLTRKRSFIDYFAYHKQPERKWRVWEAGILLWMKAVYPDVSLTFEFEGGADLR